MCSFVCAFFLSKVHFLALVPVYIRQFYPSSGVPVYYICEINLTSLGKPRRRTHPDSTGKPTPRKQTKSPALTWNANKLIPEINTRTTTKLSATTIRGHVKRGPPAQMR